MSTGPELKTHKNMRHRCASDAKFFPAMAMMVHWPNVLFVLWMASVRGLQGLVWDSEEELSALCSVSGQQLSVEESSWFQQRKDVTLLKEELKFLNGDWILESGEPLMPLLPYNDSSQSVEQVASFKPISVSKRRDGSSRLEVSGVLGLAMTQTTNLEDMSGLAKDRRFFLAMPGFSFLGILMEGYYVETHKEGVLCMLGCTVRHPSFQSLDSSRNLVVWDDKDKDAQNCNIFLQVRYPLTRSFAVPGSRGQLRSLDGSFGDIELSSAGGMDLPYQYEGGKLVAAACDERLVEESVGDASIYKGPFCSVLSSVWDDWKTLSVKSNWPCTISHSVCSKLGPFTDTRDYKAIADATILLRDLRCTGHGDQAEEALAGSGTSRVSARIRLVGRFEAIYFALQTTGQNNGLTLDAEGLWDNATGVACMAACRGNVRDMDLQDAEREDCDVRVCLYIPMAYTILQRANLVGNISSTRSYDVNDHNTVPLYFHPLSFYLPYNGLLSSIEGLEYRYTKIDQATALLDRYEVIDKFRRKTLPRITAALFKYPSLRNGYKDFDSLRTDLCIGAQAGTAGANSSYLMVDVIAMEDVLFGIRARSDFNGSTREGQAGEDAPTSNSAFSRDLDSLKVAGHLILGTMLDMKTEGFYYSKTGKLYMVGCREVREEWFVMSAINDLEQGLDCQVEVVVEYPAMSLAWIVSQSVKVSISSTRMKEDPIYFAPIQMVTSPITYQNQRLGIESERTLEGILSIVTLSFLVMCILVQGWHVNKHPESNTYVSLLMLGVQALQFVMPLIIGGEALFASSSSFGVAFENERYTPILYTVKVLDLAGFLLLLQLIQRVWNARNRPASSAEGSRAPSERKVFALWTFFHVVGFVAVLFSHSGSQSYDFVSVDGLAESPRVSISETGGYSLWHGQVWGFDWPDWKKELLEYGGLIQDLFLLPQVIAGFLWKFSGKPLCWLYFMGITVVRLLPHLYDKYRKSHFFPYVNNGEYFYANPSFDFFSQAGDVVIPALSLLLALLVWMQQSCSKGGWKCFSLRSAKYQKLPNDSFESELVKRVHRALPPIPENDPIQGRHEEDK